MNDAEASVADTPAASPPSVGLTIYYVLLVTQTVSLIGSTVSEYAVTIAVFRTIGHATPLALVARGLPAWQGGSWLVGSGPGAGMGLMFVVAGTVGLLLSLAAYATPAVRRMEADLPDYEPVAA